MQLSDIPIASSLTAPAGDDIIPILDSSEPSYGPGSNIRKLRLNQLQGLSLADLTDVAAGTINLTTRQLIINTGTTSTVNIPAPSGALRELIIMNGGSGNATVTSAATNIRTAAAPTPATTSVVATGVTARFLSNGTSWYRV